MQIDLYPSAGQIPAEEIRGRVAVVIDVLRATTTISQALANGAAAIIPVLTPEEAHQAAEANPAQAYLRGGEREGVLIPGFDLSNSPLEYTPARVSGKTILFTTTNGTRAIRGAAVAEHVLICSFLNVPAVASKIIALGLDVAICCAGTHDRFSLEDAACGGALADLLSAARPNATLGDLAFVSREIYRQFQGRLLDLFGVARHGQTLQQLGFAADLVHCAQYGTLSQVPVFRDGQVRLG